MENPKKNYLPPKAVNMIGMEKDYDVAPLAAAVGPLIGYAAARAVTNAIKIDSLNSARRLPEVRMIRD